MSADEKDRALREHLLYLLRGLLPRQAGRHARPGRYRLPQVRSRRTTRRPPARARTRP